MIGPRHVLALVLSQTLLISPVAAQEGPLTRLDRPEGIMERGFTRLVGVKELRDGRVILVDEIEKVILLLDPGLVTATPVGRSGSGPGEYVVPSRLFSLAGDSTAVLDHPNNRLMVLTPDGEPGGVINRVSGFFPPEASDGQGRFYRLAGTGDSYAILRWSHPSTALDSDEGPCMPWSGMSSTWSTWSGIGLAR